jgi:oligoendopeptidase F
MSRNDETAASAPSDLPRWDMTSVFPALDSPEFDAAFAAAVARVPELVALFDAEGITALSPTPGEADDALTARYERVTDALNDFLARQREVSAYISSFISTDATNALAQAKMSELRSALVPMSVLYTRYTAWLGSLPTESLTARSPVAAGHAYYLWEAKEYAAHLLPPGEEELSAQLSLAGGSAWGKLYSDFTSLLTVPFARQPDGETENLPMSVIRSLANDPDADTRRRAYEAEIAAWERSALPLAAAMNAIKYESLTMAKRRGWGTPLDAAVFGNHIDRATLDAMLSSARKAFPDIRRYLRAKARLVSGAERLPWYDLFAPLPGAEAEWNWANATRFVAEEFGVYSPKLRGLAERAFTENWIDAEPRPGKRDGAFCMMVRGGESRVFQNYQGSFREVSTLAHELGHAYHNLCQADCTLLQRGTPMTLAETASIFCETLIQGPALARAGRAERLVLLEAALQRNCQTVVDIYSRVLFEERTIEARAKRELSSAELCEIMAEAQRETYGDGLDPDHLHPYMWAAKPHYYGSSFYNFPYMFGLLFSLGLYAVYQKEPDGFHDRYDDLLRRSGMATAHELAQGFDIDLRAESFWDASLDVVRANVNEFEELAAGEKKSVVRSQ